MSFKVMAWASQQKTGSPTRKLILLLLADRSNDEGYCWPSIKTIAEDCELKRDAVIRNIKRLEQDGFISIVRRKKDGVNLPNHYRLNIEAGSSSNQGVVAQKYQGSSSKRPEPINEPVNPPYPPDFTDYGNVADCPEEIAYRAEADASEESYATASPPLYPSASPADGDAPLPAPLEEWIEYRKSIRKRLSDRSIKTLIKRYKEDPEKFEASVEYSIANGYQGLFAPKDYKPKNDGAAWYESEEYRS